MTPVTPDGVGTALATAIQEAFLDNLTPILGLIGLLVGVGLVIRFGRKSAKV